MESTPIKTAGIKAKPSREQVEASKVLFIDDDPQTQELRENQGKFFIRTAVLL
jgi:hypothetical protein